MQIQQDVGEDYRRIQMNQNQRRRLFVKSNQLSKNINSQSNNSILQDELRDINIIYENQYYLIKRVENINKGYFFTQIVPADIDNFDISSMSHQNILKIQQQDNIFVAEPMQMTLQTYIQQDIDISDDLFHIVTQIVDFIQFLHSQNLAHTELSTINFLINEKFELKAVPLPQEGVQYRAPERIIGYDVENMKSEDMFQLGCIILELLVRKPMLQSEDETNQMLKYSVLLGKPQEIMYRNIYHQLPDVQQADLDQYLNKCDQRLVKLLHQLLVYDPEKRATIEQVQNYLRQVYPLYRPSTSNSKNSSPLSLKSQRMTPYSLKSRKQRYGNINNGSPSYYYQDDIPSVNLYDESPNDLSLTPRSSASYQRSNYDDQMRTIAEENSLNNDGVSQQREQKNYLPNQPLIDNNYETKQYNKSQQPRNYSSLSNSQNKSRLNNAQKPSTPSRSRPSILQVNDDDDTKNQFKPLKSERMTPLNNRRSIDSRDQKSQISKSNNPQNGEGFFLAIPDKEKNLRDHQNSFQQLKKIFEEENKQKIEEDIRKKLEEDQRKKEEELRKKLEEEQKIKDDLMKKQLEEERKKYEKIIEEEKRRKEEDEKRKQEDEKKKSEDDEKRRILEEQMRKKIEEEALKKEEEIKKRMEEEQKRKEEERKKKEEEQKQQQELEMKKKIEEEQKKIEEQLRKKFEEEQKKKEEELKLKEEEQRKKDEELRKKEEEKKKLEEELKKKDEALKKKEEEDKKLKEDQARKEMQQKQEEQERIMKAQKEAEEKLRKELEQEQEKLKKLQENLLQKQKDEEEAAKQKELEEKKMKELEQKQFQEKLEQLAEQERKQKELAIELDKKEKEGQESLKREQQQLLDEARKKEEQMMQELKRKEEELKKKQEEAEEERKKKEQELELQRLKELEDIKKKEEYLKQKELELENQKKLEEQKQIEFEEKKKKDLELQKQKEIELNQLKEMELQKLKELDEQKRKDEQEKQRRQKDEEKRLQEIDNQKKKELEDLLKQKEIEKQKLKNLELKDKELAKKKDEDQKRNLELEKQKKELGKSQNTQKNSQLKSKESDPNLEEYIEQEKNRQKPKSMSKIQTEQSQEEKKNSLNNQNNLIILPEALQRQQMVSNILQQEIEFNEIYRQRQGYAHYKFKTPQVNNGGNNRYSQINNNSKLYSPQIYDTSQNFYPQNSYNSNNNLDQNPSQTTYRTPRINTDHSNIKSALINSHEKNPIVSNSNIKSDSQTTTGSIIRQKPKLQLNGNTVVMEENPENSINSQSNLPTYQPIYKESQPKLINKPKPIIPPLRSIAISSLPPATDRRRASPPSSNKNEQVFKKKQFNSLNKSVDLKKKKKKLKNGGNEIRNSNDNFKMPPLSARNDSIQYLQDERTKFRQSHDGQIITHSNTDSIPSIIQPIRLSNQRMYLTTKPDQPTVFNTRLLARPPTFLVQKDEGDD